MRRAAQDQSNMDGIRVASGGHGVTRPAFAGRNPMAAAARCAAIKPGTLRSKQALAAVVLVYLLDCDQPKNTEWDRKRTRQILGSRPATREGEHPREPNYLG